MVMMQRSDKVRSRISAVSGTALMAAALAAAPWPAMAQSGDSQSVVTPDAAAAAVDERTPEEKATALEGDIMAMIDAIVAGESDIDSVTFDGELSVVATGNDYLVTVPPITMLMEDGALSISTEDALTIDMAQIEEGIYDISWTSFDSIVILNLEDPEASPVTISFDNTGTEAVLVTTVPTLLTSNAEISNLRINDGSEDIVTIDRLALIADGEIADIDGTMLIDNASSFIMEGLSIREPDGFALMSLDSVTISSSVEALNVPMYASVVDRLEALATTVDTSGDEPPPEVYDLMLSVFQSVPPLLGGADVDFALSGLRFEDDEFVVSLDQAGFFMGLSGLTTDAATLGVSMSMDALDVGLDMEEYESFVPRSLSLTLNIADLPTAGLNGASIQFLEAGRQMGPEAAAMMSLFRIQGVLLESDARIELVDTTLTTDVVDLLVDGNIRPSSDALFGALAESRLEIVGLGEVIAAVRAMPGVDNDLLTGLTLLQTMGQSETRADGASVRIYNFELAPDGRILLNGTDISPLLSQL